MFIYVRRAGQPCQGLNLQRRTGQQREMTRQCTDGNQPQKFLFVGKGAFGFRGIQGTVSK